MGWFTGYTPPEQYIKNPDEGLAEKQEQKKKICCACPDTKKLRDSCIAERGEDHPYCAALIEAHKACLRVEGFNV